MVDKGSQALSWSQAGTGGAACHQREVSHAHPWLWDGTFPGCAHPGQHPHLPSLVSCCPQHLGLVCRLHHGAVHGLQAQCKSRAASSAQEQIAVLFIRTYAGPVYSQGFDLSLASVRIRKSGLVQWESISSVDGQQGRGDCWLFPLG